LDGTKNSGAVGNNTKAGGDVVGRDKKTIHISLGNLFKGYEKSDIYGVVREIEKSARTYYKATENLLPNPDWDEKIKHNSLNIWQKHFDNCAFRLNNFEDTIIVKLMSADKLLNFLKQIYIDKYSMNLVGDELCSSIYTTLETVVNNGNIKKISTESKKRRYHNHYVLGVYKVSNFRKSPY